MDAILSVQSIRYPLTGIGRYTYELARHVPHVDTIQRVRLFDGERFIEHLPKAGSLSKDDEVRAFHDGPIHRLKRFLARSRLVVDAYRFMKAQTERSPFVGLEDHVYHGTNFYVPNFPGPSVVTIHDLSVFTMQHFHPRERVAYLGREVEASLKRVDRIITDSDYIKTEIISYFGFPGERISVARLACGDEFKPRSAEDVCDVLSQYNLNYGQYAFYAGTIEPRKNLSNLIEAYSRLSTSIRNQRPLVLAGFKGWNNADILHRIEQGRREGWIRYLGYVPHDHLPHLLSGAAMFTFPSWYEGFGLPVLEAMASGVPVVTSPVSSIPEVGGSAVLYAQPERIDDMTEACEQALFDGAWREKARVDGLSRAATFSWQRCAEDTVHAYALALKGP